MCTQVSVAIFNQLLDALGVSSRQRPMNDEQAEKLAIKLVDTWTGSSRRPLETVQRCLPTICNYAGHLAEKKDHCHKRASAMVDKMGQIAPNNNPVLLDVVRSLNESLNPPQASA